MNRDLDHRNPVISLVGNSILEAKIMVDFALDAALFAFALFVSIFWFSNVLFPIFYGLPKALVWIAKGALRWRAALPFVVAPVSCVLGAVALGYFGSVIVNPETVAWLATSPPSSAGQWVALTFLLGSVVFRRSTRRDLRIDFVTSVWPHLRPGTRFDEFRVVHQDAIDHDWLALHHPEASTPDPRPPVHVAGLARAFLRDAYSIDLESQDFDRSHLTTQQFDLLIDNLDKFRYVCVWAYVWLKVMSGAIRIPQGQISLFETDFHRDLPYILKLAMFDIGVRGVDSTGRITDPAVQAYVDKIVTWQVQHFAPLLEAHDASDVSTRLDVMVVKRFSDLTLILEGSSEEQLSVLKGWESGFEVFAPAKHILQILFAHFDKQLASNRVTWTPADAENSGNGPVQCPACGLYNEPHATHCDCGFPLKA